MTNEKTLQDIIDAELKREEWMQSSWQESDYADDNVAEWLGSEC